MDTEQSNGHLEVVPEHEIGLQLSIEEGRALKAWLLKPAADGASALEDAQLKSTLMQLGAQLDYIEGVSSVRNELEQAGFATENMSDEEVAALGRKIAEAGLRRAASNGS
jgi:hypothetical protein